MAVVLNLSNCGAVVIDMALCNKHKVERGYIYSRHPSRLHGKCYFSVFPAKNIDGNVVKLLNLRYFMQRRWKGNACKVKAVLGWIFAWPLGIFSSRKSRCPQSPPKAFIVFVLNVYDGVFRF